MKKRSPEWIESKKQELPKILNFWEKQRTFSNNFNVKMNELCEILRNHLQFLETSTIQQIIGFDCLLYIYLLVKEEKV